MVNGRFEEDALLPTAHPFFIKIGFYFILKDMTNQNLPVCILWGGSSFSVPFCSIASTTAAGKTKKLIYKDTLSNLNIRNTSVKHSYIWLCLTTVSSKFFFSQWKKYFSQFIAKFLKFVLISHLKCELPYFM